MTKIRYNLLSLKLELEYKNKREYTWKQLADAIDVSERTLSAWLHNKTSRVDMVGLAKLIDFFKSEGMPITVADLFEVTSAPDFAVVASNPSYGGLALLHDQDDHSSANPTYTPPTDSTA